MPAFVEAECRVTGRPIREMRAQLGRLPEWYDYFASIAETLEDTVPPFGRGYLNYTHREALGVVGLLIPWNHPLLILTKKLAPALAAETAQRAPDPGGLLQQQHVLAVQGQQQRGR